MGPAQVYGLFLSLLTASADMDACVRAFEEGSLWFGAWADASRGDVHPTEMAIIVEQVPSASPVLAQVLYERQCISAHCTKGKGTNILCVPCMVQNATKEDALMRTSI